MPDWVYWITEMIVGVIMIIILSKVGEALGIYEDYPYHFLIGLIVGSCSKPISRWIVNLLRGEF